MICKFNFKRFIFSKSDKRLYGWQEENKEIMDVKGGDDFQIEKDRKQERI